MTERDGELAGHMTLTEHLTELRKRLLWCAGSITVAFLAAWNFAPRIFALFMEPLTRVLGEGRQVVFTSPAEAFITYMKVAVTVGIFASAPVIFWQVWRFVAPGLYRRERAYFGAVVIVGSFFFVGGALFGYFGVFPIGFAYFIKTFETETIRAMISVKEYWSFALTMLVCFGVAFELPVFVFFLARIGIVTPQWLWKNFRYAVLVIFIAAAIFTPPDIISQTTLGVPLVILYLLATGAAYLFGSRKKPADAASESETTDTSESAED